MALYAMCRRVWSKRGTGGSREPESFTLQKQERHERGSYRCCMNFWAINFKLFKTRHENFIWGRFDMTHLNWKITVLFGTNDSKSNVGECYWCWKKIIYFIFIWNIKTTDCRKWWHDAEGLPFPEKLPCSRCSRRRGKSPGPSHPLIQSSRE